MLKQLLRYIFAPFSRHCFRVNLSTIERYRRLMNVETTIWLKLYLYVFWTVNSKDYKQIFAFWNKSN